MAEQPLEADAAGTMPPSEPPGSGDPGPVGDSTESSRAVGGPVIIRERFLVDTGLPLPDFDSPSAKAFSVEDRRDLGRKLVALVCTPDLPTRVDTMKKIKGESYTGLLPLVEWDSAFWPPYGEGAMIIIYDRPMGGRVMHRLARKEVRITEYDMPRRIIEPLAHGLQDLTDRDAPHRAIRPDNIYFYDEEMTDVVLGENVTSPPGYDQDAIFEPIDRAMADPGGRGVGEETDDIFALGVTMGLLILGHNPVAKMDKEALMRARLEHGSYTAIFGNSRVPLPLLEPLRAMTNDDPETRWNYNEVSHWLTGQKTSQVKRKPRIRADHAFTFQGRDYNSPTVLAREFAKSIPEAMRVVKEDDFENWVKRGLDNKEMAEAIKGIVQNAKFHKDGFQGSEDYVMARICTILDPSAPIRYKGMSFMPDGFGPAMALEIIRNSNKSVPSEVLAHDILSMWLNQQGRTFKGATELQKTFAQLKGFLSIKDPGYGLERVLYEINPSLPCQSPILAKEYVVTIEHLLPSLERACNNTDTSARPLDRHSTAFIASRFDQDIHPHLRALAAKAADTSIIGLLSLLAFLQWKLRTPPVLGLASWVGGLLGPAIASYHNRITRQELEKEIPRLVRKGSLPELFDLVDNAERRQEDRDGYAHARAEWLAAEEEIRDIEGSGNERLTKAERAGQQASAMVSITLAMIVVTILVIVELL